jgi:hypothetical protein
MVCGCKSNENAQNTDQSTANVNTTLNAVLNEKPILILENCEDISLYNIVQKPIEGGNGEMSNKLVFNKKLNNEETKKLLQYVLDDNSYDWSKYSESLELNPTVQFTAKKDSELINILYDPILKHIGFINLDGQYIIPIKDNMNDFLSQFR